MRTQRPGGLPVPRSLIREPISNSPQLLASPVIDPPIWRNKYQGGALELSVNVAILAIAAAVAVPITRAPLYINAPTKKWTQPEQVQSVAARVPASVFIQNAFVEPQTWKRPAPQIDSFPNVAVRFVAPSFVPRAFVEPVSWKRPIPQIDQLTNVAALNTVESNGVCATDDQFIPKKLPLLPDLFPNIAVKSQTPYSPPVFLEQPVFRKATVQLDLFKNIAVNLQTAVVQSLPEPVFTKKPLPQIDLYPNLAALAPIPQVPILIAVEPWINKRYPPQIDVYQNTAIYTPAETFRIPPLPVEPQKSLQFTLNIEQFPNIAVNFTGPAPPVSVDQNSGGWPFFYDYDIYRYQAKERARKLEEAKREAEFIKDEVDRNIARLLHDDLRQEEEKKDLQRLKELVGRYKAISINVNSEKATKAIMEAQKKSTRANLERMQREIDRFLDEEEKALLILLNS